MPIYEYRCEQCGHEFEKLQKVSEQGKIQVCLECGAEAAKQLISKVGFRLKGQGWYETDFKSDKEKKKNLATDSTNTNASSSETKTASKSSSNTSDSKSSGSNTASKTSSSQAKSSE